MQGKKLLLAILVLIGLTVATAGLVTAQVQEKDRCSYEVGVTGDHWENTYDDGRAVPLDETVLEVATDDGTFNWGGCLWRFSDVAQGEQHPSQEPFTAIEQGRLVEGQWATMQVKIVDDVFGQNVGGFLCGDSDSNYICAEEAKGEIFKPFCSSPTAALTNTFEQNLTLEATGNTSTETIVVDGNLDDVRDFGAHLAIFANGPERQNINCGNTDVNPVGAVRGTGDNGLFFLADREDLAICEGSDVQGQQVWTRIDPDSGAHGELADEDHAHTQTQGGLGSNQPILGEIVESGETIHWERHLC